MTVLESNTIVPAKLSDLLHLWSAWVCYFKIKHMLANGAVMECAELLKTEYFGRCLLVTHVAPPMSL